MFGRFSPGVREQLFASIVDRGGAVARDLTRGSDILVVGARALGLVESGALAKRLSEVKRRGLPAFGERSFRARLVARDGAVSVAGAPSYPLATALAQLQLDETSARVLAAFDLIEIAGGACRFADVGVLRQANELVNAGNSLCEAVEALVRAREAPPGRRRLVIADGAPALQWEDGLTNLDGQGVLGLSDCGDVEQLFEAAALAEAEGRNDDALRLYDMCARADRSDALALYNYANIRLAEGAFAEAALAYARALERDPTLVEAHYNRAQALEAVENAAGAAAALEAALEIEPGFGDALFNLAQLRLQAGDIGAAEALFRRYLETRPDPEWAGKARRAIALCRQAGFE